jgi:hypothetical protein
VEGDSRHVIVESQRPKQLTVPVVIVGDVEEDVRIVGREVDELQGGDDQLGTLRIRGLKVLHLGQVKIGSPIYG